MRTPVFLRFSLALSGALILPAAAQTPYLHAPAITEYALHNPTGTTILPDGRLLRPVGRHYPLAVWPHALTVSQDGSVAFISSGSTGQLVAGWDGPNPTITAIEPPADNEEKKEGRRKQTRVAVLSPDGRTLYWSNGDPGEIFLYDVATRQKTGEIELNGELNGRKYADSFAMDLKLSANGRYLYCADLTNFRVVVIDTRQSKVVGSVDVGRYPYSLAVVGKRVYVTNVGMFEYSAIPNPTSGNFDKRGLTFPAFGFPSKEAKEGVEFEGRKVPGLGDPNAPESFSVWGLDMSEPARPIVVSKVKTGLLVGAPVGRTQTTVGGSAPNFVIQAGNALYVSNGNNDLLERLNLADNKIAAKIPIQPSPLTAALRGVGPSGMAVAPNGKRLYVAESGINAIAVVDIPSNRVLGHIPTAWYPYRVAVSPDGKKLLCLNFRGFGNGPSGGKRPTDNPYLGLRGVMTVLPIPTDRELEKTTQTVLENNGMVDKTADLPAMSSPILPTTPGKASKEIKYVVFITKENHTYDAVFDRIPGANDDPSLLRWGLKQTISAQGQPTLKEAPVMTNHNALAREFTVSDNFYMQPEASGVGHRWLVGIQPNNFSQMNYTLGWEFKAITSAPGRRASYGSNGSIMPEDYPEAGSMWEHLARYGKTFRNYGEGFEFAGVLEDEDEHKTGAREVVNIPMPKVLYDNTCREFPIFNMNIPDQYRAYWFEKDFTKLFLSGPQQEMPHFVNIAICNDHGTGPKPNKGYPYVASWMADNDLALGRIVDFLSHTKYWKNMAIFVTQDDSGGEPDHVDGQRSVLLAISPWIKRHYVSHRHTTILSMHRTLYQLLGLPPLNQFDALANDFSDCFTTTPDFRPYNHVAVDARIFDPEKAKDPKDPDYKQARKLPSRPLDNEEDEEIVLKAGANQQK